MYNIIKDPVTKQPSNIFSKEGRNILRNYRDLISGGAAKSIIPIPDGSIIPPADIQADTSISSIINKVLEQEAEIKALCLDRTNPVNEEYFKYLMKIEPERIKYIHPTRTDYHKYLKCAVEANGICLQYAHPKIFIVNEGSNIDNNKEIITIAITGKESGNGLLLAYAPQEMRTNELIKSAISNSPLILDQSAYNYISFNKKYLPDIMRVEQRRKMKIVSKKNSDISPLISDYFGLSLEEEFDFIGTDPLVELISETKAIYKAAALSIDTSAISEALGQITASAEDRRLQDTGIKWEPVNLTKYWAKMESERLKLLERIPSK